MSRNLGRSECSCGSGVARTSVQRPVSPADCGKYAAEYAGMLVADAQCLTCGARYLAWVDETTCTGPYAAAVRSAGLRLRQAPSGSILDLSWRSTFNDEPGAVDLPVWLVDQFGRRATTISDARGKELWGDLFAWDPPGATEWRARRDRARDEDDWSDQARALRAVLLFHSASPWDSNKAAEWHALMGKDCEATTRELCRIARRALGVKEGGE